MFETFVVSHLADLCDSGLDESLDAIQGLGAGGVTLIVTSPPLARLRCAAAADPRVLRSRGGYFFQPDAAHYADTHLAPVVSSWVRQRQPLTRAVAACRQRGLAVRLRISAFEVGRIAGKHPEAAAKTVYGDVASDTLCPASAAVRALLRGTIRDLAERFAPDAIELSDLRYHSGALGAGGLAIGFDPGPGFLALISLCFSEASRQAAAERDIDTEAAARWVKVTLDRALNSGEPLMESLGGLLRDAEIPRGYMQCQQDTLDTLLVGLMRSTPVGLHLVLPGDDEDGVVPSSASVKAAAGVVLEADIESSEDVALDLSELRRRFGDGVRITLDLDAAGELGAIPQGLVSSVKAAVDQRAAAVSFSEWGIMPSTRLAAIKQAVRYAVRSSS